MSPVTTDSKQSFVSQIGHAVESRMTKILDFMIPRNPVTEHREFRFVPVAVENFIGQFSYNQVCPLSSTNKDGKIVDIVRNVFDALVSHSARKEELKFEVRVMQDDQTVNAFCLPGGKVVITTGMINELKKDLMYSYDLEIDEASLTLEDKLSAVLGHEIAHACAGHGARSLQFGVLSFLAIKITGVTLGYFLNKKVDSQIQQQKEERRVKREAPMSAQEEQYHKNVARESNQSLIHLIERLARFAKVLFSLKHSRCHEFEADKYGIKLAAMAGYDLNASIWLQLKFLEMKGETEDGKKNVLDKALNLIATHPPSIERLKANRETIASLNR